jgi:TRAP-type C4-dicarboxylate transport system permease small subunit
MKVLRLINDKLEEYFLIALMVVAVLLVTAQIVTRLLGIPLPWSEELARYSFLWLTWIGAAYATKVKRHIVIDIVVKQCPAKWRRLFSLLATLIWFIFLIFMIVTSSQVLSGVIEGGSRGTGSGIPMAVPYASVTVGVSLMTIRLVQNLVLDLISFKNKEVKE